MNHRSRCRAGRLVLAGLLLGAMVARAQSAVSSTAARAAQFVFVIDDSGSMRDTDPDRLAIFAVQSLVSMLDDRDEVSLVRLNGPRDGAPVPPIEPLRQNRKQIQEMLDLRGGLASYNADNTPCRSALAAVHQVLQQAQRPGVAQVVMLLTDGKCTPAAEEEPSIEEFLGGLRSHQEKLFQFYLLGFRGAKSSPILAHLAERTGGQAVEANPGDPTSILKTFADALSRSQGYEPYLLSPQSRRLAAHRGAERVRLLAVAPGTGSNLSFIVHNSRGATPQTAGQPRTGTHHYGNGRVFRYAALDYRPDTEPVDVEVQGADETWKVVALPEYRLGVRLAVLHGTCEQPGAAAGGGVETGATVCAVAELVNDNGAVVGGEVTGGDLTASLRVRRPDAPGTPPIEVAANQLPGGNARFGLVRSNLPKGDYELQPVVTLRLSSGEAVTLTGPPVSLVVSSLTVEPKPARFDFGRLRPGGRSARPLTLGGSFPKATGRLELADRADLPSCITVELGEAEGKPQPILVNNPYTLTLHVYPYCGPRPFSHPFQTAVRLVFDSVEGGRQIPAVVLPVRFFVDYRIAVPPGLAVKVRGGEAADLALPVSGNFEQDVPLRAVVAGPGEAEAWPEDPENLRLGFAGDRRHDLLEDDKGEPLLVHDFIAGPGRAPLRLRARPDGCCAGGSYRTRLGLAPAATQPLPPGARPPEPIVVPVRIDVEAAGFWACYGQRVLLALAILLVLLLLLYLINMIRNSAFLRAETLAGKLKPLVWTEYGDAVEQKSSKNDVHLLVRRGMPTAGRVVAWLRANPLRFGLPGGRYRETVELLLQPNRDVARSQISLVPDGDLQTKAEKQPASYVGRLFATAAGGTTFVAVPDPGGRVSRLVWQDGAGAAAAPDGEAPPLKAIKLRKARLLRPLEDWEAHSEGMPAGWQVG